MKKLLLLVAAVLGALAFWRRDTLKDDVNKAGDAVKGATDKVRSRGEDAVDEAADVVADTVAEAADAAEPATP
jgi:hypothetical protein